MRRRRGQRRKGRPPKKKGETRHPPSLLTGGEKEVAAASYFMNASLAQIHPFFPLSPFFWMDLSRSRLLPAGSFLPPFKQTSCLSALTLARPDRPSSLFSPELVMHAGQRGSGVLVVVGRRIDRF